jgi:K+-transporting ATPase ATPase B chain
MNNKSNSLFESKQVKEALVQSLCKAKPKIMFKNWSCLPLKLNCHYVCLCVYCHFIWRKHKVVLLYNFIVFLILLATLCLQFAEAIAERGKAR